jgi:flavin reductase (DIM6/NTAB) family NADH-FMN oxidoreductase RutF/rubredoxin
MDSKALWNLTYGMSILGSKDGNRPVGCTVNTVIQVSSEPIVIAVCVNRNNFTNQCIKASGGFSVSLLSEEATGDTIGKFGFRSGKDINKFDGFDYRLDADGFPLLTAGTCGWLSCKVVNSIELDTHTMFFGTLTDAGYLPQTPMTYSYYQTVVKGKTSVNAPTFKKEEAPKTNVWKCPVCGYEHDNAAEPFEQLPADWVCPLCGAEKKLFEKQ